MSLPRPMSVVSPVQAKHPSPPKRSLRPEYLPFPSAYCSRSRSLNSDEKPRADSPPAQRLQPVAQPQPAYTVAKTNVNHRRERTKSPSKPKLSKLVISGPVSPPFYPSIHLDTEANHESTSTTNVTATGSLKQISQDIPMNLTWHSALRCILRISTIALNAAIVVLLAHTLGIYHSTDPDVSIGLFSTPWPNQADTTATYVLFSIAFINLLFSVAMLVCSVKTQFSMPMGARDKFRVATGAYTVISWVVACTTYKVLDTDNSVSMGHFACTNVNTMGPGREDYRTVCREQNTSFYIAMISGVLENLILASYIFSVYAEKKAPIPVRDPEKGQTPHIFKW